MVLPVECADHFMQFTSAIRSGRNGQGLIWSVVWFSCIWTIWNARNILVFNGCVTSLGQVIGLVQFKSWLWVKNLSTGFHYSLQDWEREPKECLIIRKRRL